MFYVCPRAEESSNISHIIQFTESLQWSQFVRAKFYRKSDKRTQTLMQHPNKEDSFQTDCNWLESQLCWGPPEVAINPKVLPKLHLWWKPPRPPAPAAPPPPAASHCTLTNTSFYHASLCSCMPTIILLDGAPSMSYDIAPSYVVQDKVSHCSQAYLARRCIFCNYIFNGTLQLLVQKVATKAACLSSIRIGPTCPRNTTICPEKEKRK